MRSYVFVLGTGRHLLLPCCRSVRVAETLTVNSPRALRMNLVLSFETSENNHLATQCDNTDGPNRQSKSNRLRSLVWRSVWSQTMH